MLTSTSGETHLFLTSYKVHFTLHDPSLTPLLLTSISGETHLFLTSYKVHFVKLISLKHYNISLVFFSNHDSLSIKMFRGEHMLHINCTFAFIQEWWGPWWENNSMIRQASITLGFSGPTTSIIVMVKQG
ncbi:hypothetical protein O6H91_02G099300 [Diphasiastrum complanatum]|uniref:Uncharacterized protein n=1 Tax=Diphasiastrum complanatum TaxID=34168 RepID=A0ACC2EJ16_DIPCM|nr:hypothetical protein O6H91_02G099300 [Diphasiastrum complanatum]